MLSINEFSKLEIVNSRLSNSVTDHSIFWIQLSTMKILPRTEIHSPRQIVTDSEKPHGISTSFCKYWANWHMSSYYNCIKNIITIVWICTTCQMWYNLCEHISSCCPMKKIYSFERFSTSKTESFWRSTCNTRNIYCCKSSHVSQLLFGGCNFVAVCTVPLNSLILWN